MFISDLGIPIARVRKQNPKARPIYPMRGRIHIVTQSYLFQLHAEYTDGLWVLGLRVESFTEWLSGVRVL